MARKKLLFSPLAAETPLRKSLGAGGQLVPVMGLGLRSSGQDTRPLAARHVVDLAESISVLGLLEPIVVEPDGSLLAGAHRRAAVQLLAIKDPAKRRATFLGQVYRSDTAGPPASDRQDGADVQEASEVVGLADRIEAITSKAFMEVPVQVIAIPKDTREVQVLAVEAAENNVRRPYTHDEIWLLAKRLEKAGYRSMPGKPKRGERSMLSALEAAVGRSKRQIQNILLAATIEKPTKWKKATAALERAAKRIVGLYTEAQQQQLGAERRSIVNTSDALLEALQRQR
jgi:hypothetical protein